MNRNIVESDHEPGESADTQSQSVLDVSNLVVEYVSRRESVRAVDSVSFTVHGGESVALVGESGSGKSTIVHALLGILPDGATRTGLVRIQGNDMSEASPAEWASVRRKHIGYIPQDPRSSLDPTQTVGRQIAELVRLKENVGGSDVRERVLRLLQEAGMDDPELRSGQYPHELSGGLLQRVLIAQALAGSPSVLVADEPTSALDVTVQKVILDRIEDLVRNRGIVLFMVTHDLAVASDRVNRILVMHHGSIVEEGITSEVIHHPQRPYTRALIQAAPSFTRIVEGLDGQPDVPKISDSPGEIHDDSLAHDADAAVRWKDVSKTYQSRERESGVFHALEDVNLVARRGETLAVVGESGSGKSTLLRIGLGLVPPSAGKAVVNGIDVTTTKGRALRRARRGFQLVQQNPYESLDPRMKVRDIIEEPLKSLGVGGRRDRHHRSEELVDMVSLPTRALDSRLRELSGGQCQRVAIARALALMPKVVMLDEPVSALDVSVQSQIIDLLNSLQKDLHLTFVFVSHDLAVVALIANRVAVFRQGRIVETGEVSQVLRNPRTDYTSALIDSIPGRE